MKFRIRIAAIGMLILPSWLCMSSCTRKYEPIERAKLVLQPMFDNPGFSEGFTLTNLKDQWGYFDRSGKLAIDLGKRGIKTAWDFGEGMAKFKQEGKYGFLDREGNIAIPPKYDHAWPFPRASPRFRSKDSGVSSTRRETR
jgi:hypothetical protein